MVFSFDTIYFCVYNNIMAKQIIQAPKSKIDNKFVAYTYIMITLCWFVGGLFIIVLAAGSGANLDNYWEGSVSSIMLYLFYLGLFFLLCKQLKLKGPEIRQAVDLNKKVSLYNISLIFLLAGLVLVSFMLFVQGFSDIMIWSGYKVPGGGLVPANFAQYVMGVFTLCFFPAVIEELLFRGIILKGLLRFGKMAAIVGSAVLFAVYHHNPEQLVFQFILGIVFAAVVLKTGNLLYGMILHFLNNFSVVTITYILGKDPLLNLAWNLKLIAVALGLAAIGAVMVIGVVKSVKVHDDNVRVQKTEKFFSLSNIGYFIGLALAFCVLIIIAIPRW